MKIEQVIIEKLTQAFRPSVLDVVNESHMHNVPAGSESHFKVVLVSEAFSELNKVKQHQAVYKVLADELAGEVHALALHTFDEAAWTASEGVPLSPNCMGGSGK